MTRIQKDNLVQCLKNELKEIRRKLKDVETAETDDDIIHELDLLETRVYGMYNNTKGFKQLTENLKDK